MALLSPADQEQLRGALAAMSRRVTLLFFTQTFGCDACLETRLILDELPALSSQIAVDEVNLVLEPARAAQYGIDRAPSIVVLYDDAAASDGLADARIRFVGTPGGFEFVSLVEAVLLAGGRPSTLSPASLARLAAVARPLAIRVFSTPTCPHCPRAVNAANEMAFASPFVTATAFEATEFPDLVRRYRVSGVPKTIVNDDVEILGALPEDDFVEQALAGPPP